MKVRHVARSLAPFAVLLGLCHAQGGQAELFSSQIHDVRDLVRTENTFCPATVMEASFVPSLDDSRDDSRAALDIADLVTLVQESTSPRYWESEGTELRAEDGGFVVATCSEEMHARIRGVLGQVRQLLFQPVLVEVHELPGSVLGAHGSVLTAGEAEALLAQAGEHRVLFGRSNPRKPLLLEAERTQNHIVGLGAKIANDASAPELDVATEAYGASWTVHARRTLGEELLVTISGSDRSLEPGVATRQVPAGADATAVLELRAARIATCHASSYLRPGQALLVGSSAPGGVALCVRVQSLGQRVSGRVGELTAYAVASLVRGAVRPENVRVPYADDLLFPYDGDEPMPAVFDDGRLMEWLSSQVAPDTWDGSPNTMHFSDSTLYVNADDDTQKAVAERLRALQAIDARQFSLEVRFGEVGADAVAALRTADAGQLAESLPQHCLATISASREARMSATRHTPYVRVYEAVVASSSAAIVPRIDSFAEGFLLRGRVAPMDKGNVLLDLQLTLLAHGVERPVFDVEHPRLGQVDKVDVRRNKVRGATAVELDKWTVLYLAPVEGGAAHVAVVARVRSL